MSKIRLDVDYQEETGKRKKKASGPGSLPRTEGFSEMLSPFALPSLGRGHSRDGVWVLMH